MKVILFFVFSGLVFAQYIAFDYHDSACAAANTFIDSNCYAFPGTVTTATTAYVYGAIQMGTWDNYATLAFFPESTTGIQCETLEYSVYFPGGAGCYQPNSALKIFSSDNGLFVQSYFVNLTKVGGRTKDRNGRNPTAVKPKN